MDSQLLLKLCFQWLMYGPESCKLMVFVWCHWDSSYLGMKGWIDCKRGRKFDFCVINGIAGLSVPSMSLPGGLCIGEGDMTLFHHSKLPVATAATFTPYMLPNVCSVILTSALWEGTLYSDHTVRNVCPVTCFHDGPLAGSIVCDSFSCWTPWGSKIGHG